MRKQRLLLFSLTGLAIIYLLARGPSISLNENEEMEGELNASHGGSLPVVARHAEKEAISYIDDQSEESRLSQLRAYNEGCSHYDKSIIEEMNELASSQNKEQSRSLADIGEVYFKSHKKSLQLLDKIVLSLESLKKYEVSSDKHCLDEGIFEAVETVLRSIKRFPPRRELVVSIVRSVLKISHSLIVFGDYQTAIFYLAKMTNEGFLDVQFREQIMEHQDRFLMLNELHELERIDQVEFSDEMLRLREDLEALIHLMSRSV